MLFNPIITDFVKTSHLFHVIIIELKRQKQMYSIILPESKKVMSSKITLNRQRHKGAWLNRIQKEVEKVWPPPLSQSRWRSGDCICPMKTVTLRRSDIFRTHVLHVYTYPGVFTDIFELNLISIYSVVCNEGVRENNCSVMYAYPR